MKPFYLAFCEHLLVDAKGFGAKSSAVYKVAWWELLPEGITTQLFSFQRQSINLASPPSFVWLDFGLWRIQLQAFWVDSDCTEMQRTTELVPCTLYLECGGTIYSRFWTLEFCVDLYFILDQKTQVQASFPDGLARESSRMKHIYKIISPLLELMCFICGLICLDITRMFNV